MLSRYLNRFVKWGRYALGTSYQHVAQGPGLLFQPGKLEGYYNDLTSKADWQGLADDDGVPVVVTDTRPRFQFAIVIFQWALGHWDLWLRSGRTEAKHLAAFQAAVRWALANQTTAGGWSCWDGLERPVANPFSAMAQGEGLSVLARALTLNDDAATRDALFRAADFLFDPAMLLTETVEGITRLEEYPGGALRSVLNGWIFALVGVHDAALAGHEPSAARQQQLAADLAKALPLYDVGYWSRYDLAGNLASPFYHRLHVDQLRALSPVFPDCAPAFLATADRFERYQTHRLAVARAVLTKVVQKLRQPAVGEMR
ncbi:D-glucuronyl C5-epimerase family protein [Novosphingobium sp.]|uniref:D-glucuronyl C5-epimerase family protein n=1 Tax=Novosphingobium sp. TaxID=1874826 RepID=UPI0038BA3C26